MSSSSPFEKLPAELLAPIFSRLRPWDLYSVALTCKSFVNTARQFLWERVGLSFTLNGETPDTTLAAVSQRKADAKLEALHNSPQLGRNIKHLSLFPFSYDTSGRRIKEFKKKSGHWVKVLKILDLIQEPPCLLQQLYVSYPFLPIVSRFSDTLRSLRIEINNCKTDVGGILLLPCLPAVTYLGVYSERLEPPSPTWEGFYPHLLMAFSQYLCNVPNVKHLLLQMEEYDFIDEVEPPNYVLQAERHEAWTVFQNLQLKRLEHLEFELAPTFLQSTIEGNPDNKSSGQRSKLRILDIFDGFMRRHNSMIKRFRWFPAPERHTHPAHAALPVCPPIMKAIQSLSLKAINRPLTLKYILETQTFRRNELEELRLTIDEIAGNLKSWIERYIAPFGNLKVLKILNARYPQANLTEDMDYQEELYFGGNNLMDIIHQLPTTIERISMSTKNFAPVDAIELERREPEVVEWFNSLPSLHSVRMKYGERLFVDRDSELIYRRRPGNSSTGRDSSNKVIKVWHLEPAHRIMEDSHFKIWSYREYHIQGVFKGGDGRNWSLGRKLSSAEILKLKNCVYNDIDNPCSNVLSEHFSIGRR